MDDNGWNLRELYRTMALPGANPLKVAHKALDRAVRIAYGMGPNEDPLTFLLALNGCLADHEANGDPIVGPGLPFVVKEMREFISADRVTHVGRRES